MPSLSSEEADTFVGHGDVRIVSLNCWGLKYISKHRQARIKAIAERLAASSQKYDIVALQEIWVEDDFNLIRDSVAGYLKYERFYYSGIITGPGLAIFSRWPIVETWLYPFSLNGRPSAFFRGDWYVGKSVSSTLIRHPSGQIIDMLNAHFHAPYGKGDASYECHRTSQAWSMARIAHTSSIAGYLPIVVGDLNSTPTSLVYRLLTTRAPLSDCWVETHGFQNLDKEQMAQILALDQIRVAGTTCDSLLNTWRQDRHPGDAKRLDYILIDGTKATASSATVSFTEQLPDGVGSYSDHFAIEADIKFLHPDDQTQLITNIPPWVDNTTIRKTGILAAGNEQDTKLKEQLKLLEEIQVLIDSYVPVSKKQKFYRVLHFYVSIGLFIGMGVGVWWGALRNRSYVAFILYLAGSLVLSSGLINGLIGFLFGRYEERALREFFTEVELAKEDCQWSGAEQGT